MGTLIILNSGQMLNHLDFKTFVGGNLGVPLSEAALQCLTSTPQSPMFKARTVLVRFCFPFDVLDKMLKTLVVYCLFVGLHASYLYWRSLLIKVRIREYYF